MAFVVTVLCMLGVVISIPSVILSYMMGWYITTGLFIFLIVAAIILPVVAFLKEGKI